MWAFVRTISLTCQIVGLAVVLFACSPALAQTTTSTHMCANDCACGPTGGNCTGNTSNLNKFCGAGTNCTCKYYGGSAGYQCADK